MELKFAVPEAYEVVEARELPYVQSVGARLRHKKSGAKVLVIANGDENKVFNITFRTLPSDSTGVAHITEHSVLCGSRAFPLKDPFVELAKGSLNTFLNAMTAPDKTMYPVASINAKDFHNLMHVYLDAVFYPRTYTEPRIFMQEGWSYEMNAPEDDLKVNGVVYNEMKGVFSSPDECLQRTMMESLYPDTPYGLESGGDPDVIPELTYEDFIAFHKKYYHPSNSYIYLYGDADMESELDFIDKEYLSAFDEAPQGGGIPMQEPFGELRRTEGTYPLGDEEDEEKRTYLALSFAAGDRNDLKECCALDVLGYVLVEMPGAPVSKALIDAGVCENAYGGFSDSIAQPYFSIIAENADADAADKFLSIIKDELKKAAENGIDEESVRAWITKTRFTYSEADFGTIPKGLMYGLATVDTWMLDEDNAFSAFEMLNVLKELEDELGSGYLENLVRKYMLSGDFESLVVLRPEKGLAARRAKAEAEALAKKKAAMSKEEIEEIVAATKDLRAFQNAKDSDETLALLPMLSRGDIKREVSPMSNIIVDKDACEGLSDAAEVVLHDVDASGVAYVNIYWDASGVAEEELPVLSLMAALLGSVDTEKHTYRELANEINKASGGIAARAQAVSRSYDKYRPFLAASVRTFIANADESMAVLSEIISQSKFDDEGRIYEKLSELMLMKKEWLVARGHTAASLRAEAGYSPAAAFDELTGGIEYYLKLKEWHDGYEEKKGGLIRKMKELADRIFVSEGYTVSVTMAREESEGVLRAVGRLMECLPKGKAEAASPARPLGVKKEAFITTGKVQYAAVSGTYSGAEERYSAVAFAVAQLLNYGYLWEKVRVTGGAYGVFGSIKPNGTGAMVSYRDPHLKRTLDVFSSVPEYLRGYAPDARELDGLVIGAFGSIDVPKTPRLKGEAAMLCHMNGVTDELRQKRRDALLFSTADDIRSAAGIFEEVLSTGSVCVIGSEEKIRSHEELFDEIRTI